VGRDRRAYFRDDKTFDRIALPHASKIPIRHSRARARARSIDRRVLLLPRRRDLAKQANKKVMKYPSFIVQKRKRKREKRNEREYGKLNRPEK